MLFILTGVVMSGLLKRMQDRNSIGRYFVGAKVNGF
jgi:hypothetical protein